MADLISELPRESALSGADLELASRDQALLNETAQQEASKEASAEAGPPKEAAGEEAADEASAEAGSDKTPAKVGKKRKDWGSRTFENGPYDDDSMETQAKYTIYKHLTSAVEEMEADLAAKQASGKGQKAKGSYIDAYRNQRDRLKESVDNEYKKKAKVQADNAKEAAERKAALNTVKQEQKLLKSAVSAEKKTAAHERKKAKLTNELAEAEANAPEAPAQTREELLKSQHKRMMSEAWALAKSIRTPGDAELSPADLQEKRRKEAKRIFAEKLAAIPADDA